METLRATNLGQLQNGSEVNFERYAKTISMYCIAYVLRNLFTHGSTCERCIRLHSLPT